MMLYYSYVEPLFSIYTFFIHYCQILNLDCIYLVLFSAIIITSDLFLIKLSKVVQFVKNTAKIVVAGGLAKTGSDVSDYAKDQIRDYFQNRNGGSNSNNSGNSNNPEPNNSNSNSNSNPGSSNNSNNTNSNSNSNPNSSNSGN